ncbi:hypothetical protein [Haloferula sargassicola]|uniref:hypothetical protein n=1 Tax=Haloferula sargassicola TaxID=490096 RepID=UPI0033653350
MSSDLIAGITGSVLGVAGGLIGTYFSYRRARSARERRFVIRTSTATFVFVGSFLAILILFPQARPMVFPSYVLVLSGGMILLDRRWRRIRKEEAAP